MKEPVCSPWDGNGDALRLRASVTVLFYRTKWNIDTGVYNILAGTQRGTQRGSNNKDVTELGLTLSAGVILTLSAGVIQSWASRGNTIFMTEQQYLWSISILTK